MLAPSSSAVGITGRQRIVQRDERLVLAGGVLLL